VESVSETWNAETRAFHERALSYFEYQAEEQMRIGREIATKRDSLNLTQKQLQDISGVGQAEISKIETGAANPTRDTLIKLASALHLRVMLVPEDSVEREVVAVGQP
jgi:predicted transcriptional regulator